MKFEHQKQSVALSPEVKQYLKAVEKKLRLPKKIKQSVLSDLITEMSARAEAGERMEQVIKDMGTPLQVAQSIHAEMDDLVYVKSPWRWACLGLVVICAFVLIMRGYSGALLFLVNKMLNNAGPIGGFDGPTQIFVTAPVDRQIPSMIMAGLLLVMGVIGFINLSHCHKKQE